LRKRLRVLSAAAIAGAGIALIAGALAANQVWLDRHFLPSFLIARVWYVRIESSVRLILGAVGLGLMVVARPLAARITGRTLRRAGQSAAAIVLALVASELVLERGHLRPVEWRATEEEPRRRTDPRVGWTFEPARTGYNTSGGRVIEYVVDPAGYRVRRTDRPIDPARPSVLFAGESVLFGDGLAYDETIPARVESMLGVQSVNMSVYGYSTDQMYLRLEAELPRFAHPVAVVTLFMSALFGRNLDDDRPHLGDGLTWQPAQAHARLVSLAGMLVAFRRDETVSRGIAVTRQTLRAMVNLAHSRGATALIAVPQFGPEDESQMRLRRGILDEEKLPYVLVEIDPAWHIAWDRHPDARAAELIARQIAVRLRTSVVAGHF
jgi:hypothetical protein